MHVIYVVVTVVFFIVIFSVCNVTAILLGIGNLSVVVVVVAGVVFSTLRLTFLLLLVCRFFTDDYGLYLCALITLSYSY